MKSSHIDECKLLEDSVSSGPPRKEGDAKMDLGNGCDLMPGLCGPWNPGAPGKDKWKRNRNGGEPSYCDTGLTSVQ